MYCSRQKVQISGNDGTKLRQSKITEAGSVPSNLSEILVSSLLSLGDLNPLLVQPRPRPLALARWFVALIERVGLGRVVLKTAA